MRVLIVDDDPAIRRFVDAVLTDAGYETVVATDGEDALDQTGSFGLLVTDLTMPRMTGDALAMTMIKKQANLKVLYLAANGDQMFKKKVTLWRGEAFLDKPATPQQLLESIEKLLEPVGSRSPSSR